MRPDRIAAFWGMVQKTETCWLWTGSQQYGYGTFYDGSRTRRVHRLAYEMAKGPVTAGMVLDHLCRVRHCVNPAHLEAVTQRDNVRRGAMCRRELRTDANYPPKTECPRGHPLSGPNLNVKQYPSGRFVRCCVQCQRMHNRKWDHKRRGVSVSRQEKETR